ncbi:unnamed protein product, partial [Discosporangium mesarthrocarpum]
PAPRTTAAAFAKGTTFGATWSVRSYTGYCSDQIGSGAGYQDPPGSIPPAATSILAWCHWYWRTVSADRGGRTSVSRAQGWSHARQGEGSGVQARPSGLAV